MHLIRRRRGTFLALLLAVAALGCEQDTARRLAVASDTFAHGLANAQAAVQVGVSNGFITAPEASAVNTQFVRVATAGLQLNQAIRANASEQEIAAQISAVLAALDELNKSGVAGIKNENSRLAVSLALTGAQAAIATVSAAVGGAR